MSRRNEVERAQRQSGAVHVVCISRIALDQQRLSPVPVLRHHERTEPSPVYYVIKNRVAPRPLQMFSALILILPFNYSFPSPGQKIKETYSADISVKL